MNPEKISPRPYRMKNEIQHYDWGTKGENAFIPQLLDQKIVSDKAYAELWLGTHVNAPSEIEVNGAFVPLNNLIKKHPVEMLGKKISEKYKKSFPFLLKILSAGEALSIQVHPDKSQAEKLHQEDPYHYPDDNHKPEIAIALDTLTALAGIKDFDLLLKIFKKYPEIPAFAGKDTFKLFKSCYSESESRKQQHVREFIENLIKNSISDKETLLEINGQIKDKILSSQEKIPEEEALFLELEEKYEGDDIGLLFIFLLRLVHLNKGEGLYIRAGVPHAYLKGNIIECMSNSDNVVRLGLTPKFKDTQTLIDIMDFDTNEIPIIKGVSEKNRTVYDTPIEEFQICRIKLTPGMPKKIKTLDKAEIILVTAGEIEIHWKNESSDGSIKLKKGQSVFVPAFLSEFEIKTEGTGTFYKVNTS